MKNLMVLCLTQYCSGDQIEKNEMGGACSTYERIGVYRLWWGNPMERDHLEDPGIDGRIILRCNLSGMGHGLD